MGLHMMAGESIAVHSKGFDSDVGLNASAWERTKVLS
jgi:hypothetical protein